MTLTVRQRAKINAALCMIHDSGHNADAVSNVARDLIRAGANPRSAYERALNSFVGNTPDLLPSLTRVVGLVEASDDATVSQYDAALSSYIATGDDSGLKALAPTISQDMGALAARNGDVAPDFSAEFQEMAAEPVTSRSSFAFDVQHVSDTMAGRQIGPTGMVAPKAQQARADAPYVGPISTNEGAAPGTSFAAAKEAARSAASRSGVAIIEGGPQAA